MEYVGVTSERHVEEQRKLLTKLLDASQSASTIRPQHATATLDALYLQILREALHPDDKEKDLFQRRLDVLHAFLCTIERTSTSVVTHLLGAQTDTDPGTQNESLADYVLGRLHAVLYTQGDQVLAFHKSFPDFIFDKERSREFYCNQASFHHRLAEGCFNIMLDELRFNIAQIADSSVLDRDNLTLKASIEQHVIPSLRYTSRSWSKHLSAAAPIDWTSLPNHLHAFLHLPILFWIEVMNLLGLCGVCDQMLREARDCVASKVDPFLNTSFND